MTEKAEQTPFYITPEEIIDRMRYTWLTDIEAGHSSMLEDVIPHLEFMAIERFGKEWTVQTSWRPNKLDDPEGWRLWWLNEASHNCATHTPVGSAGHHLSKIGQAAVNILMAASSLRDALENGEAEKASALSILLICEAMEGGYTLEFDALKLTNTAIEKAKKDAWLKGAGRQSGDMDKARLGCIHWAKELWKDAPTMRIGAVADTLLSRLIERKDKLTALDAFPKIETIKAWLKDAATDGKLTIPEAAQRRGRPTKGC